MTSNNSLYSPFEYGQSEPNPGLFREESWMNFLAFTNGNQNNIQSSDTFEEIAFEKPQESNFTMDMEVEDAPYDYKSFADDFEQDDIDFFNPRENRIKMEDKMNDPFLGLKEEPVYEQQVEQVQIVTGERQEENAPERSECSQCHSDEEEIDTSSVSTNHSYFGGTNENDVTTFTTTSNVDENIFADQTYDFDSDFREKVSNFMNKRPQEERQYIEKVTPMLINSFKEHNSKYKMSLSNEVVGGIVKELLYKKEQMISEERKVLNKMVEEDMNDIRGSRLDVKIKEEEVMSTYKRKIPVNPAGSKGRKNKSSLNHINENYVSNIFQFAKRNYLEDKELQKVANERNVSALNFRKLMAVKMTDDIMTRKAKARITGAGRELLSNVEAYMTEGYFEQCADREKYIWNKEKALRDLALTGLN